MFPMQIKITITNAQQLQTLASLLAGEVPAPKKTSSTCFKPKEEDKALAPAEGGATPPGPQTAVETLSIDELRKMAKDLTMRLVNEKSREDAVALLAKFGVTVTSKLPEDKLSDFCNQAQELLK